MKHFYEPTPTPKVAQVIGAHQGETTKSAVNARNKSAIPGKLPGAEELLTKDELAKRLKLTRRGVECISSRRLIPIIRISHRCVRFSWEAVQAALAKLEIKEIGR